MKIGLYSPYVPEHFGGGEKYFFDVATVLAQKHEVFILVPNIQEAERKIAKYESFLGYTLAGLKWMATPLNGGNFLKTIGWTGQFDLLYYITDGSLFFSFAKKNILHIQIPLLLDKSSVIEQLKLKNWQVKNTNSYFTKQIIEKSWPTKIDVVHHPKVNIEELHLSNNDLTNKKNVILNVGRFFKHLHSKRQDVLVSFFKELPKEVQSSWKLVLIGSIEDNEYFNEIKAAAKGFNIELFTDVSRKELLSWYKQASIYWHAAGFEVDQLTAPEKVEHFGITTVEAMASGCVPIVINKGGQPEILGHELKELLWESKQECLEITKEIVKNAEKRKVLAEKVSRRAEAFGKQAFEDKLWKMVNS